jgi:hypothetical protein
MYTIAYTGLLDTKIDRQIEVTIRFLCLTLCIMISGTRYNIFEKRTNARGSCKKK